MDESADSGGSDESSLSAVWAGVVAVGDEAQHGQVSAGVVLSHRGESEVGSGRESVVSWQGGVKLYTRDLGS